MKKRIVIYNTVVRDQSDTKYLENSVESFYTWHPNGKVTWLSAAGRTHNMITAICEWEE